MSEIRRSLYTGTRKMTEDRIIAFLIHFVSDVQPAVWRGCHLYR